MGPTSASISSGGYSPSASQNTTAAAPRDAPRAGPMRTAAPRPWLAPSHPTPAPAGRGGERGRWLGQGASEAQASAGGPGADRHPGGGDRHAATPRNGAAVLATL